ncbi:hypothetical protein [Paraburkholderia youngii]|uniref:hypothetical protein n=1 Tax=Paraburkholderia youngii TaxID=2782701 RepID=UPI003D19E69F
MQITDWLPELCAGEPPRSVASNAEFHIVLVTRGNERLQGFCGRYDRTADAWCDENGKILAPRGDEDRWVLAADHNAAFARAARRARTRKDSEVSKGGPLSLMWRYGFRGIAAKN